MKVCVPGYYSHMLRAWSGFDRIREHVVFFDIEPGRFCGLFANLRAKLAGRSGGPELRFRDSGPADAAEVQGVVLGWNMHGEVLDLFLKRFQSLRWVHVMRTGVDHLDLPALFARNIQVTSCKGLDGPAVSEFVMAAIFSLAKNMHSHGRSRTTLVSRPVAGAKVCIFGTGAIGAMVAGRAKANGMRVAGVNTSGAWREPFDTIHAIEAAAEALADADFLVACLPETPGTNRLLSLELLEKAKKGACLVNVGRPSVIEPGVLREAIEKEILSGAILDIDHPGDGHPYSGSDRILITNHSAFALEGASDARMERMMVNISEFLRDGLLAGAISRETGY